MTPLVDATEMYLRTVYELYEEGVPALRARLVERLGVSAPAVSETVNRMIDDGLMELGPKRAIILTTEGQRLAAAVMRKHRLAERLLTDVIGLEWCQAHNEACKWEHVISDHVESKIAGVLHHPETSPYGNPIPRENAQVHWGDLANLLKAAETGGTWTVARISEQIQTDLDRMLQLEKAGAMPGATVTCQATPDGVTFVVTGGGEVSVDRSEAKMIWVEALA